MRRSTFIVLATLAAMWVLPQVASARDYYRGHRGGGGSGWSASIGFGLSDYGWRRGSYSDIGFGYSSGRSYGYSPRYYGSNFSYGYYYTPRYYAPRTYYAPRVYYYDPPVYTVPPRVIYRDRYIEPAPVYRDRYRFRDDYCD